MADSKDKQITRQYFANRALRIGPCGSAAPRLAWRACGCAVPRAARARPRIKPAKPTRKPGFLKGKIRIAADFDAPLPDDLLDAFEGKA